MDDGRGCDIAVVMAVYGLVSPAELRAALDSLLDQSWPPSEVVIVADGDLTRELEMVIEEFLVTLPRARLSRQEHRGSGPAKQRGLELCTSEFVAIADADDINLSHRLETQGRKLASGHLDLLGSAMVEFDSESGQELGVRRFPSEHDAICRALRIRNVFNHPTVVLRRSLALQVGGYRGLDAAEDYELWARMIAAGARTANCPEVLVRFRGGGKMLERRRSRGAIRAEWELQVSLHRAGIVPRWMVPWNWLIRNAFRVLPRGVLPLAYRALYLDRPNKR